MAWKVSTRDFTFGSHDGETTELIDVLDSFMEFNNNVIPLNYPASYEYDRKDPLAQFLAARYFAQTFYPDNYKEYSTGMEVPVIEEPDASPDAVF